MCYHDLQCYCCMPYHDLMARGCRDDPAAAVHVVVVLGVVGARDHSLRGVQEPTTCCNTATQIKQRWLSDRAFAL